MSHSITVFTEGSFIRDLCLIRDHYTVFNNCAITKEELGFLIKGECSVFKKNVMDENDALSEYNKIPLGHNRTNGAVYSKIYSKVEICFAH